MIGFGSTTTLRDEMISTGEYHSNITSGFCDSLLAWGTSSAGKPMRERLHSHEDWVVS